MPSLRFRSVDRSHFFRGSVITRLSFGEKHYFCDMKRGFSIALAVLAAAACTPEMSVTGEWGLYLDPAGMVTVDSLVGTRADSLFADTKIGRAHV